MHELWKNTPEISAANQVIAGQPAPESGVTFSVILDNTLYIQPPMRSVIESDDQLIAWYVQTQRSNNSMAPELRDVETHREVVLQKARIAKSSEFVGGFGMTDRNLSEIEEELPGVSNELYSRRGKIAVFGNGLSELPLIAADRFNSGDLEHPLIIVDLFNYDLLERDLRKLIAALELKGLAPQSPMGRPLDYVIEKLHGINEELQHGSLISLQHYFGVDVPSPLLHDLSLAINCFGPSYSTQRDQLALLQPGSSIYTTSYFNADTRIVDEEKIWIRDEHIITRIV